MHWCIAYRPTSFSGVFLVSAVPRIPVFSSGHGVFRGNRDRTRLGPLTAHVPTALASRKNLFLRRCVPLNYFIVAGMATRMLWSKEVNGIVLNTGCKLWLAELSIWDLHISRSYCWNGWSLDPLWSVYSLEYFMLPRHVFLLLCRWRPAPQELDGYPQVCGSTGWILFKTLKLCM